MWDDIALELARIERAAFDAVRKRMSERQLGEAWADLAEPPEKDTDQRVCVTRIFRGSHFSKLASFRSFGGM